MDLEWYERVKKFDEDCDANSRLTDIVKAKMDNVTILHNFFDDRMSERKELEKLLRPTGREIWRNYGEFFDKGIEKVVQQYELNRDELLAEIWAAWKVYCFDKSWHDIRRKTQNLNWKDSSLSWEEAVRKIAFRLDTVDEFVTFVSNFLINKLSSIDAMDKVRNEAKALFKEGKELHEKSMAEWNRLLEESRELERLEAEEE